MPSLEVMHVRIKGKGGGPAVINASDFDPEKHARLDETSEEEPQAAGAGESEPTGEPTSAEDEQATEPAPDPASLSKPELITRLEELGGNLAEVEGTGSGGNVVKGDVLKAVQKLEAAGDGE